MTLTGSNLAGTPHRAYGAVLKETDLTREGGYIAWDVDTNNPETELQAFSHPFASLWLRNTDAGSIDWAIEESSDRQDWSTVTSGSLAGSTADTVADVELSEPYVRVSLSEDGHDAVLWMNPTPNDRETDHTGQEANEAFGVQPTSDTTYEYVTIERDSGLLVASYFVEETGTGNDADYIILTSARLAANRDAPSTSSSDWREEIGSTGLAAGTSAQGDFDRRCRAVALGVREQTGGSTPTLDIELEGTP
jgi:hypothetical protein